jgi:hypothetical protein
MSKRIIMAAAFSSIILTAGAQANSSSTSAVSDEVKPPVFAFTPQTATETFAFAVPESTLSVWNDDYRPAPPSFYAQPRLVKGKGR